MTTGGFRLNAATRPRGKHPAVTVDKGLSWSHVVFNPTSWSSAGIRGDFDGTSMVQPWRGNRASAAPDPVDKTVVNRIGQRREIAPPCLPADHRVAAAGAADGAPVADGGAASGLPDPAPGATPSTASDSPCGAASPGPDTAGRPAGFSPAATIITIKKIAPSPVSPSRRRSPLRAGAAGLASPSRAAFNRPARSNMAGLTVPIRRRKSRRHLQYRVARRCCQRPGDQASPFAVSQSGL